MLAGKRLPVARPVSSPDGDPVAANGGDLSVAMTAVMRYESYVVHSVADVATQLFRVAIGTCLRAEDFRIDREGKESGLNAVGAQALHQAALPHPDDAVLAQYLNQIAARR